MLAEGVTLCCCCCCAEIGSACRRLLGPRRVTKINYLIMVLAFIVPVVLVTYLLDILAKWLHLSPGQVIARSSFVLLIVFVVMLIVSMCRNKVSMVINQGLFTVKYIALAVLFVTSLFISSGYFQGYAQVARILSLAYMLIQSIILIDIFYILGRSLVGRYEQGEEQCGGIMVGLSVIFIGGAITLNVLSYTNFDNDSCQSGLWLNVAVSCLMLLLPIVQILQINPQNNLLTTSLVALLISYFSYSAQLSVQNCNHRLNALTYIIDVSINLFLFVLATYGTISGGLNEQPQIQRKGNDTEQQQTGIKQYSQTNTWLHWHSYMCLASVYLCMVFSNWLAIDIGQELKGSDFAFIVKSVASIGTGVLYIWTMIAPGVFPERSFEFQ